MRSAVKASVLALAAVTILGAGVASAQSADAERIAEASRAFSSAIMRGDTSMIRDLYMPDAIVLPPGREVRGGAEIVRFYTPNPNRVALRHSLDSSDLEIEGDLAIDVGIWSFEWRGADGDVRTASDRYLVVWRRSGDGRWRMAYDIWHRPEG